MSGDAEPVVVVGLTPDVEAPTDADPAGRYHLKLPYVRAVQDAGGLAMILPYADDPARVGAYLDRLDALVVTGGAFDVPPDLYGEAERPGMGAVKLDRTRFEAGLLRGALARGLPVLGVCGGMQLLNVVRRGTLYQDLAAEVPGALEHEQQTDRRDPGHRAAVTPGSRLADLFGGRSEIGVNTTHHQAVARLGAGLIVSARAPDGVVEAIEDPDAEYVVGVQWHPELLAARHPEHQAVYDGLVRAARRRAQEA